MLTALLDAVVTVTEVTVGTGVVFAWAERIRPSVPDQPHWRRGMLMDLGYSYLGAGVAVLLAETGLGGAIEAHGALGRVQAAIAGLPLVAQIVLAVIVGDFMGYWKHRLLHTRLLWPFHAVHHSSEDVDWLSNERLHPVEMVLMAVMFALPLLLLGFSAAAVVWSGQIRRVHSVYEHANLDIAYGRGHFVLVSPIFHRWHHSSDPAAVDTNFANIFSLWDWMFGTIRLPREAPPANGFGVEGFPRDFFRQLVVPVRDAAVALRRAPPAALEEVPRVMRG